MPRDFSRRAFLRTLGLGAAGAAFLPLLNASGQETTMPRRLVLFFTPHGTHYDQWIPTGTQQNFQLAPIMAPLQPFQRYLVPVGNLRMPHSGHDTGVATLWTGGTPDKVTNYADGLSLDQFLAPRLGASTPFRSLEAATDYTPIAASCRPIYAGPNQPISPTWNAADLYEKIYLSYQPDRVAERLRVLDAVNASLGAVRSRLGEADRPKLDAHLASVRDLETRLAAQARPRACATPAGQAYRHDAQTDAEYADQLTHQFELLAQALICDMTRVASVSWARGNVDGHTFSFLTDPQFPGGLTDTHHDISHTNYSGVNPDGTPADPKRWAQYVAINRWFADRLAHFLGMLAAAPEGAGSVLDNTLVIWGSEIANGSHASAPAAFLMAGGAGGGLRTGQFVDVPVGTPHNRLLVTAAQALGQADVARYGSADPGSGGLPGLLV